MPGLLVVTACDEAHYPLAEDLVASLRSANDRRFRIGFIQMGDVAPPPWLIENVDEFKVASGDGEVHGRDEGFLVARLAIKARLPEYFPGYDTYVWMDSDTWVQDAAGVLQVAHQARDADISIHPQIDPDYWRCEFPDDYTLSVYERIFGPDIQARYARRPMLNNGVFGARAGSPLWGLWRDLLVEVRARQNGAQQRFFSDQIPLHYLIYSRDLSISPLRAVNNWLVLHAEPAFHGPTGMLTTPTWPRRKINILHLVGPAKDQQYPLGASSTTLRYCDMRANFGHLWKVAART